MSDATIPEGWTQYSPRGYVRERPAKGGSVKVVQSYRTNKWSVLVEKQYRHRVRFMPGGAYNTAQDAFAAMKEAGVL